VCSDLVVIAGISLQDPAQVRLAQDDDMVEALAPDRSDQSSAKLFCQGDAGAMGLSRMPMNSAHSDIAIDAIAIPDEVARRFIPRECFRYLVRDPFCCWILCHVDPDQLSPIQPDHDEGIEQAETDSRDHEQIHGSDVWGMVPQKAAPSLAGRPPSLDHVFGHNLGDSLISSTRIEFSVHTGIGSWKLHSI
jgi:hypothetical protein